MILGREQLIVLEEFEKRQYQIYDDACDVGYEFTSPEEQEKCRVALVELMKMFNYHTSEWYGGRGVKVFIPIEREGPVLWSGSMVDISYHTDNTRKKEYITILTYPTVKPESFWRKTRSGKNRRAYTG